MRAYLLVFLTAAVLFSSGCQQEGKSNTGATEQKTFHWKMVMAWPKNFPGLGTSAEEFARNVNAMSNGRLNIKVYGAGELVPALEVFDAVSQGTAQMGHSSPYYWKGKITAAQFFTTTPFGMTALEMNSWMQLGGGQELLQEIYDPFNLVVFPIGNTGMQMAGWFNKEINTVSDLKGLKMRIPGLGGEVLARAGGAPVMLPGGEIFTALQTGTIDATEWVGPYNDLAFGLHKAAKYYYYPGWWEGSAMLHNFINLDRWESLPPVYKAVVRTASEMANGWMMAKYDAVNPPALRRLIANGAQLRPFSPAVLDASSSADRPVADGPPRCA